jgi:hypothetical protein
LQGATAILVVLVVYYHRYPQYLACKSSNSRFWSSLLDRFGFSEDAFVHISGGQCDLNTTSWNPTSFELVAIGCGQRKDIQMGMYTTLKSFFVRPSETERIESIRTRLQSSLFHFVGTRFLPERKKSHTICNSRALYSL